MRTEARALKCRNCRHFDQKGEDRKTGQRFGMCRAWDFSVNEDDARTCSIGKREAQEEDDGKTN